MMQWIGHAVAGAPMKPSTFRLFTEFMSAQIHRVNTVLEKTTQKENISSCNQCEM